VTVDVSGSNNNNEDDTDGDEGNNGKISTPKRHWIRARNERENHEKKIGPVILSVDDN
jgi:hypothetical protein